MRRVTLAAVAALLLAVPAAAPAAEVTKKSLSFAVTVGPNDDQPCTVVADLYTPAGTTRQDPAPAILATNGFGGSKDDFDELATAYATRGYVFLAYSGLGFGNSGCKITLDDPDYDGKAGRQLVDFLGGTKAAEDGTRIDYVVRDAPGDPRVGMIGGSYGGQIQFAIAMQDPRLDTIVPQITWNDLAYSLTPNNTDLTRGVTYDTPGVAKIDWPVLFTALGVGVGFQQAVQNQDPSHLGACPNFTDRVCTSLVTSGSLGYPTPETLELLRHASVASYVDRIRIPTFVVQGLSDTLFNINEAVATYQQLHGQDTPVKMLWRSNGHSGGGLGGRESSSTKLESAYESRMALEWFDFYLRGLGEPPRLDFSFMRDWALGEGTADAAPAVGSTPTYPASTDQQLFLSGANELVGSRSAIKDGSAQFAAVAGSPAGSGNGFQSATGTPDAPGTSAAFTSAALGEDFDVVGIPRVTVTLSAPAHAASQGQTAGKLVLFAKLLDVAPDGTATLPRNQLSAVRVADVGKPVTIDLPGISHRFAKGHQVRLVITTSNATNRTNNVAGPVTIASSPANVLTLPKLGAQAGPTGSGPSGTTPFVPAPGAPAPQKPGAGFRPLVEARSAVGLPSSRRCVSRRRFVIRLRRAPRGDRHRSAVVTVDGKRAKRVAAKRGRRMRSVISLRGLAKGIVRVRITIRTAKGRTLRGARTYRTCVPKRKSR